MNAVDVFIGIGSNIEPEHHIYSALEHLARQLEVVGVSNIYETEAIGRPEQPDYLNGVVLVRSEMAPEDIKFRVLRPIETALGRLRSRDKYAPRPIDLDILIYGEKCFDSTNLIIPDPDLLRRFFLAAGVIELAPDLIMPGTEKRLADSVVKAGLDELKIAAIFTEKLKKRFNSNE